MTHPHTHAAATVPWALNALGEFLVGHPDLEPTEVSVSTSREYAVIYVDAATAFDWPDAFDSAPVETSRETAGGVHHELAGTLAGVRVIVRWFAYREVVERHLAAVTHADAFHVACEGGDDNAPGHVTLCLDDKPCEDGGVERVCPHLENLCDECRLACVECRIDRADDLRGEW